MLYLDKQIENLSELLLDLPYENEGMLLSEFDGFVAGLMVSPEMIKPSEWLPVVWGNGSVANFKDGDHAEQVIKAVMAHYNHVAKSLTPPKITYSALIDEDVRNGKVMWEQWVSGFEMAMGLRLDCWADIVEGDDLEAVSAVNVMVALFDINNGRSDLGKEERLDLMKMAPDLIPDLVASINYWTKGQHSSGPPPVSKVPLHASDSNVVQFRSEKVGRNDACPCGSGRKFKKCCGV